MASSGFNEEKKPDLTSRQAVLTFMQTNFPRIITKLKLFDEQADMSQQNSIQFIEDYLDKIEAYQQTLYHNLNKLIQDSNAQDENDVEREEAIAHLSEGLTYLDVLQKRYEDLLEAKKVDVVIVGGGPVGLWTAIQLKSKNPNVNIQILEKYETYKRTQTLRLDLKTIDNPLIKAQLLEIAEKNGLKLKGHSLVIPIQLLESCFSKEAERLGIVVKKNVAIVSSSTPAEIEISDKQILTLDQVAQLYSNAKAIIGADGSHSAVRKAHFGAEEDSIERKTVQYLVEFKYQAPVNVNQKPYKLNYPLEAYPTEKLARFRCDETVKVNAETGIADISLRFIVDKETYEQLGEASFQNPITNLKQLPLELKNAINVWMRAREMQKQDGQPIPASMKVSKIPLDIYTSKQFIKPHKKSDSVIFLVGDAAFGVPYFRALNAGLSCANKLSKLLATAFYKKTHLNNLIIPYTEIMRHKYMSEERRAMAKDIGLEIWKSFVLLDTGLLEVNRWRGTTRKKMQFSHHMLRGSSQPVLHEEKEADTEDFDKKKKNIMHICQDFLKDKEHWKKEAKFFYTSSNEFKRAKEMMEIVESCRDLEELTTVVAKFIHTGQTIRDKTISTFSPLIEGSLRACCTKQVCPTLWNEKHHKMADGVTTDSAGSTLISHSIEQIKSLVDIKPVEKSVVLHPR